jgi:KaiC/GvpD/RAD55 family RecA-like ATPase
MFLVGDLKPWFLSKELKSKIPEGVHNKPREFFGGAGSVRGGSRSMVNVARSGLERLDMVLGGGIPRGSIVLVEESNEELSSFPSGYLCNQFLYEGLKSGELGVLVLSEHLPSWYLTYASSVGMDLRPHKSSGLLKIVDAFTSLSGSLNDEQEEQGSIVVKSPSYGSELSSKLLDLYGQLGDKLSAARTVMDSLSISIYMMGFNEIWKMLLKMIAQSGMTGHTGFLILYPQMHEQKEVAALERVVDGIIEFRGERAKSSVEYTLRVKKMRGMDYSSETIRYFKTGESLTFG